MRRGRRRDEVTERRRHPDVIVVERGSQSRVAAGPEYWLRGRRRTCFGLPAEAWHPLPNPPPQSGGACLAYRAAKGRSPRARRAHRSQPGAKPRVRGGRGSNPVRAPELLHFNPRQTARQARCRSSCLPIEAPVARSLRLDPLRAGRLHLLDDLLERVVSREQTNDLHVIFNAVDPDCPVPALVWRPDRAWIVQATVTRGCAPGLDL